VNDVIDRAGMNAKHQASLLLAPSQHDDGVEDVTGEFMRTRIATSGHRDLLQSKEALIGFRGGEAGTRKLG